MIKVTHPLIFYAFVNEFYMYPKNSMTYLEKKFATINIIYKKSSIIELVTMIIIKLINYFKGCNSMACRYNRYIDFIGEYAVLFIAR